MNLLERRYSIALQSYRYKIMVFAKTNERELPGYSLEDIQQELGEVLWRVVENYDPDAGAKFNTFFWQCARNRMTDLKKKVHAEKRRSEWFELESLDPDSLSVVYQTLEQGSWEQIDGLSAEEWYMLRETILERRDSARKVS